MTDPMLWLTEADANALLSLNDAIPALANVLQRQASGAAKNLEKVLVAWDPASSMHNLGAVDAASGYGGFKSWVNTPQGAQAVYILFDTIRGSVRAIMQANTLGTLRTAGIAGLATDRLAAHGADRLAIIGTGRQAFAQVAAIAAIRPLRSIHIFSPNPASRMAFRDRLAAHLHSELVVEPDLHSAFAHADIVTIVTRARDPFIEPQHMRPGQHINALGAILPHTAELTPEAMARCDRVIVDSRENAVKGSAELRQRFGTDLSGWSDVQTLGQVVAQDRAHHDPRLITCFKAMGMGLSDLAMAIAIYERARSRKIGVPLQDAPAASVRFAPMGGSDTGQAI